MSPTDTVHKILVGRNYADTAANGMESRDLSILFMTMQNQVFDDTLFMVTNPSLFIFPQGTPEFLTIRPGALSIHLRNSTPSLLQAYEYTATVCFGGYIPINQGQMTGCQPGPDCPFYQWTEWCEEISWVEWEDDGTTGAGGSTGTGGGGWNGEGGGVGHYPNEDPGWTPIFTPSLLNYWSQYPITGLQHLQTTQITRGDALKIDFWKENRIDVSELDPCLKAIVNKLMSGDNDLGRVLAKLDRASTGDNFLGTFSVKYIQAPLGTTLGGLTTTSQDPVTGLWTATITINSDMLPHATDLSVARTIIHETIHAYLRYLVRRINSNPINIGFTFSWPNSGIFDQFVKDLYAHNIGQVTTLPPALPASDTQRYHHNYMANHLINIMANALRDYDNNRVGGLLMNEEYYWLLSWEGLFNTDIFRHFWPNYHPVNLPAPSNPAANEGDKQNLKYAMTDLRLRRIQNVIASENLGDADALGKLPGSGGRCY